MSELARSSRGSIRLHRTGFFRISRLVYSETTWRISIGMPPNVRLIYGTAAHGFWQGSPCERTQLLSGDPDGNPRCAARVAIRGPCSAWLHSILNLTGFRRPRFVHKLEPSVFTLQPHLSRRATTDNDRAGIRNCTGLLHTVRRAKYHPGQTGCFSDRNRRRPRRRNYRNPAYTDLSSDSTYRHYDTQTRPQDKPEERSEQESAKVRTSAKPLVEG